MRGVRVLAAAALLCATGGAAFMQPPLAARAWRTTRMTCRLSMSNAAQPDGRVHSPNPTVGPTNEKKIFDKVLKASSTGAKGTHVRALMNPLSPGFDPKFKEAWDNLSKAERNEVLRKQDQQIATKQSEAKMGKNEKKKGQLEKRAEKKFKAMDTDGIYVYTYMEGIDGRKQFKFADADASGAISMDELRTAMMSQEVFGSFSSGPANEADVKRRFAEMDINSDGKISLTEFQDGLARESKKRQEDFWGTYAGKDTTIMDLAKIYGTFTKRSQQKQDGPIQIVIGSEQKQDGAIQIVFETAPTSVSSSSSSASLPSSSLPQEGPDVVADALAKLSSLSTTAIEHLGPDATAGPTGSNDLSDFREKAIDDLRKSIRPDPQ
eukprot:CAMPEP_0173062738 /NCGR_PEP_ID=MMETSP1102-20130122/3977_1 /TAXON_ID=49646 /ORGANISM="Geminigera sp., Strain Caron Lab Isolate" /LENGTH=378 /DNA_ID=CAMNT_0013929427 /DNA_START=25 /DNA_END=1162 /DNA_ORIENTATION=+